jgi:hypothetical protein
VGIGALALALPVALALTGCGAASEDYEIAGIDQLEIPTPSPDPDDFVASVDNPWLPLAAGNVWTYDVTAGIESGTTTVQVSEGTESVAGVTATVVETTDASDPAGSVRDYYAQDRDGNVWWFGREGEWEAGVDGAQAGLAMPADPRVGDGWRLALSEGVVEDRATVESVADGQLVVRVESDLAPDLVVQRTYEDGVGLSRTFTVDGPPGSSVLTSGP